MSADDRTSLTPETVLVRAEGLLEAEIDGQTVMMSMDKGEYYGLDAIGSEIWALLANPRSVAELCSAMLERYDVEPAACERDVLEFLGALVADGSLRPVRS